MKETEKILAKFAGNPDKIFTPKDLQKACKVNINRVRRILTKLMKQNKIVRVSRGQYRYAKPSKPSKPAKPPKPLSKDKMNRYLTTLEKTCEIAIHELMLTESLVGKDDKKEIEHQIAYFARYLVKARWEAKHGSKEIVDVDEAIFKKAKRIHEWSKYIFEKSRERK
ncbi:MAG: hypothetical protein JSV09_02390 [Thermoplasmata archaeon]|nr:MAG: hypothetical protein JSV09_02390 [Thermoplasmata archaeon]